MQAANKMSGRDEVNQEINRITVLLTTDLAGACLEAEKLSERFPENFDALMFYGFVNMRMRRRGAALGILKKAARFKPNDYYVHLNIGLCLLRGHRLGLALQAFKKASLHLPKNVFLARVLMAVCHHRLGSPDKAVRILRGVVRRHPNAESVRYCLLLALRDIHAYEEADRHANILSKLLDQSFQARRSLIHFMQTYDHAIWDSIDNKVSLHRLIKRFAKGPNGGKALHVPEGFTMPDEYDALVAAHRRLPSVWIVKPENLHTGQGIRLIETPEDAPQEGGWIVQRYLENPYLLHGRKANFRITVLFTSYSPLRVYLFRGASARLALEPYSSGPIDVTRLAMHIDQRSRFVSKHYEKQLSETSALTGNKYNIVEYPGIVRILENAGCEVEELWSDLTALVEEFVRTINATGLFRAQSAAGCRYAYFPKVLSLDIFLDKELRPWLLEAERIPSIGRMFDGTVGDNPVLQDLFKMLVFPFKESDEPDINLSQELKDEAFRVGHQERLERERCGRFVPLNESSVTRATTPQGGTEEQRNDIPIKTATQKILATSKKRLIEAGHSASALAEQYPDSAETWLCLGTVYRQQRQFDSAIEAVSRALELRPGDPHALALMGACLVELGNLLSALQCYELGAQNDPRNIHFKCEIGRLLHCLGEPEKAASVLGQIIKDNPSHLVSRFLLMKALRENGRFAEADNHAELISRYFRNNEEAISGLISFAQNHDFHGYNEIDDKIKLAKNIEAFQKVVGPNAFPLVPQTFSMPDENDRFLAAHSQCPGVWIVKPRNLHSSNGIYLTDQPEQVRQEAGWLVQRYLDKPFLFKGRKVVFRVFLLISSVDPPRVYLFFGGRARFALQPYREGHAFLQQMTMHLPHGSIFDNETDLIAQTAEAIGNTGNPQRIDAVWPFDRVMKYIEEAGFEPKNLWEKIERLAIDTARMMDWIGLFKAQSNPFTRYAYVPKLLALDLFLDETMQPWLLEIERRPHYRRLFDSTLGGNVGVRQWAALAAHPLLQSGVTAESLVDPVQLVAHEAALEDRYRGRFIRVFPE